MAEEQVQEQQVEQPTPELTIVDLQNLRAIIDVAARRGAFGASEMAAIGNVFNKLDTFLQVAAPQAAAEETAPAAE